MMKRQTQGLLRQNGDAMSGLRDLESASSRTAHGSKQTY